MTPQRLQTAAVALLLVTVALAGCKVAIGSPSSATGLQSGLERSLAEFAVLDLRSGAVVWRALVPDLTTNPAYTNTLMVFRRLQQGDTTIGSAPSVVWRQSDETLRTQTVPGAFLGVFEVSRAQWARLGGGTPTRAVSPVVLAGGGAEDLPVCGVSLTEVQLTLTSWSYAGRLILPTHEQWERGCRAGSNARFAWGDSTDLATVSRYAVVSQTAVTAGPDPIESHEPNAWGFYNMHGNVWEWVTEGQLRGGSWHDGLPLARSANQLVLETDVPHALAGVRLVYAP